MSLLMRKNLSPFKLISFDVTGTLLTLRHSPGTIYERVAREKFGYTELDVNVLDKGFRRHFKALAKEYPNFGKAQAVHWKTWWSKLVQRTLKDATDKPIDPAHLKAISEDLIERFETAECWKTTKETLDFVRHIKDMDMHSCIITNSDPRTERLLRNLGFPEFDFVLSAYEVGVMKPDPRIFQMALTRCDLRPREAMHIGNDAELDYAAANRCSWTGVLINSDLVEEDAESYKFKQLSTFLEHLERK